MTASTWWYIVGLAVIFGIFFALDIFINSDAGVKPKHKPRATDWFDRPEERDLRIKPSWDIMGPTPLGKNKPIEEYEFLGIVDGHPKYRHNDLKRPKFGGW